MEKVALIVAGGEGKRMNSETPKQFLLLNNLPILMHVVKKFCHFDEIIVVLPQLQFNYWHTLCDKYNFKQKHSLIEGGETRFHSVKNGLKKITTRSIVAIHDGVRPIISTALINHLTTNTKKGVGVIPIIPVKDSIRKVEEGGSEHIDRNNLYKTQTPQCFISEEIKNAYAQNYSTIFTDDACVFESNGGKITSVLGEEKNLKITTIEDLKLAEVFMQ